MSYFPGTGAEPSRKSRRWRPEMHVNKVHRLTTIDRVAADLGENVDRLYEIALEMDVEDGIIWIYDLGDQETMAFTDFGIETLVALIKTHRDVSAIS